MPEFIKRQSVPPSSQYNIIATFTPAIAENINQIVRVIFSEMYQRKNSLDKYINKIPNMILFSHDYYMMSPIGTNKIKVGQGCCLVDEVFIETSDVVLSLNEPTNYLFHEDSLANLPNPSGVYELAVSLSFSSSGYDVAVIGFVTQGFYTRLISEIYKHLILGFVRFRVTNGVVTSILDIYDESKVNPKIYRNNFSVSYFDAGRVIPESDELSNYNIIFEGGIVTLDEHSQPFYDVEYDGLDASESDYPEVTLECGDISSFSIYDGR